MPNAGLATLTPEAPGLVEFESVVAVDTPDIARLHDLILSFAEVSQ